MKILVNTPAMSLNSGGVANHFYGLLPYWNENVKYNVVGKRSPKRGSGKYWIIWDLFKFILLIVFWRPNYTILNPSMAKNALKRDFIFLKLAKISRRKVVVFIHGFHPEYCETIDTTKLANDLNAADGIFVLADNYRQSLIQWGVRCPVLTTTTKVDDRLLQGFNINDRKGCINNILFLSRVEKEKGIYETVDAFSILKTKYPNLILTIVGQGTEQGAVKQYVVDHDIQNVVFTGRLQGGDLVDAFKKADIYCFPSYSEGMPTSVLEAMAFGLPIVARNVGGLVDFFEHGKMGFVTDSFDPQFFADAISTYIDNKELSRRTSLYNYQYANEHFLASRVAKEFEEKLLFFK